MNPIIIFPGIHISFLCTLTVLHDWFHGLIKWFLCRNLTSRIALGWRIRMTNHLLQYYLKRNAFYKVSHSPMEYSPGLYCTVVSFLYLLLFFCAACISSLDEQAFNTVREFWLLLMVDCSCGLCVSRVPVYNTVQPQSGTIVFFSHFYIWSNWIDKVRECDNLTCSVFTPHSALILD